MAWDGWYDLLKANDTHRWPKECQLAFDHIKEIFLADADPYGLG